MSTRFQYLAINFLLILFLAYQSLFVVYEGEKAFLLRFGEVVRQSDNQTRLFGPGLHFKWPMIERAFIMDARLQTGMVDADKIQTVEQVYLMVDFYFKWRISDFERFFKVSGGGASSWSSAKLKVEALLKQKIKNAVFEEFGHRTLSRLISEDRKHMSQMFEGTIQEISKQFGVALVDFQLKQIELPEDVSEKVYHRMRTEREKTAATHRARGQQIAAKIEAETDYDVQVILADAQKKSRITRGQAEAESAHIYAATYSEDIEFYEFMRSLETYRHIFNEQNNFIVLRSNNPLFHGLSAPPVLNHKESV
jgi:membrane protease subunit HflC